MSAMPRDGAPTRDQRRLIETCLDLGVAVWWQGRGTLLISRVGAVSVIDAVEAAGDRVIGLEGFELDSTAIHPRLDLIYDAGIAHRGGAAAVADGWGNEIWIDMTLGARRPEG